MGIIFSGLLVIFLVMFFGLDIFTAGDPGGNIYITTVQNNQVLLSGSGLRVLFVLGIVFCEFVIIFISLFDRILDTFRVLIRPIVTLVPLGTFLFSIYDTFKPVVENLLPGRGGLAAVATEVNKGEFNNRVLISIGAMLLYLLVAKIFGGETQQVRELKAELRKLKKT